MIWIPTFFHTDLKSVDALVKFEKKQSILFKSLRIVVMIALYAEDERFENEGI